MPFVTCVNQPTVHTSFCIPGFVGPQIVYPRPVLGTNPIIVSQL